MDDAKLKEKITKGEAIGIVETMPVLTDISFTNIPLSDSVKAAMLGTIQDFIDNEKRRIIKRILDILVLVAHPPKGDNQ